MKYVIPLISGSFILLLFFLAGVDNINTKRDGGFSTFTTPNNSFESLGITENATTTNEGPGFLSGWESLINPSSEQEVTPIPKEETEEFFATITESVTNPFSVDYGDLIWLGGYSNDNSSYDNANTLTPEQEVIHTYGNELGTVLSNFNLSNSNQTEILSAFLEDRSRSSGLKNLSDDYMSLSQEVANVDTPEQILSTNSKLSGSYKKVGELLWALSSVENDEDFLDSLLAYNKSSEEVVRAQLILISLFGAHGVVFESHEPGGMFSFKPSSI